MTILDKFCLLIKKYEGWFFLSRSWRNKNPGNLRWSPFQAGRRGGFAYFRTYEEGWKALKFDVLSKWRGRTRTRLTPDSTILDFFEVYAPAADSNKPKRYAQFVAKGLKVPITTKLGDLYKKYKRELKAEETKKDVILYRVKRGDTLWAIGRKYGIPWQEIYKANKSKIKDPHWIYPGQIFVIPKK